MNYISLRMSKKILLPLSFSLSLFIFFSEKKKEERMERVNILFRSHIFLRSFYLRHSSFQHHSSSLSISFSLSFYFLSFTKKERKGRKQTGNFCPFLPRSIWYDLQDMVRKGVRERERKRKRREREERKRGQK